MVNMDELEQLARAATPGPWEYVQDGDEMSGELRVEGTDGRDRDYIGLIADNTWGHENGHFIAAANPAVVLELVQRLRAAEAIVRDLAMSHQIYEEDQEGCPLCKAPYRWEQDRETTSCEHAESCPYRRAVEAMKRKAFVD